MKIKLSWSWKMQRFQGCIKKSILNNTLAIDFDLILTFWTSVCINYNSKKFINMEVGMWYHLVYYYVWTKSCSWWNQTLAMVKLNMVSLNCFQVECEVDLVHGFNNPFDVFVHCFNQWWECIHSLTLNNYVFFV